MSDNEDELTTPSDRRLQSLYYELDKKVHTLELSDVTKSLEISALKGEVMGLRTTAATSTEMNAAAKFLELKLEHLHKDLAAIKTILMWGGGLVLAGVIGAVLRLVLKDGGVM